MKSHWNIFLKVKKMKEKDADEGGTVTDVDGGAPIGSAGWKQKLEEVCLNAPSDFLTFSFHSHFLCRLRKLLCMS